MKGKRGVMKLPWLTVNFYFVPMVNHHQTTIWENLRVFPKIGVHQNEWFIMENPIKIDDLGGLKKKTIFGSTPIFWLG